MTGRGGRRTGEVSTILPFRLLYHDTRYPGHPIGSVGAYFIPGAYPDASAESWAYKFDPNSSPQWS